jgi:phosphatidylglycerol phospholipase C
VHSWTLFWGVTKLNLNQKNYIERSWEILPQFPVMYIGFSLWWASRFLKVPGVHFNIGQQVLVGPLGHYFLKAARKAGRKISVWTVNKEVWMEWSIRHEVDAVVTDNPKKFLEVCDRWEKEDQRVRAESGGTRTYKGQHLGLLQRSRLFVEIILVNIIVTLITLLLYRRFQTRGLKKVQGGKA